MSEKQRYSPQESNIEEPPIKTSAGLAKTLGLTRNPKEKERWYREYWKRINSGEYITLAFQDGKYGGERIIIGVKRDKNAEKNYKERNLCQDETLAEEIKKTGLSLNEAKMFIKSELKNGGYLKLYRILLKLKIMGV